ncbi:hypothetical protein [Aquella oligotrophica]|uniref:Uncharacterized protein n=1 Tax=Aquella oligotrophica TaxID=2067065 RepID=A0A2I7N2X6_9NEIS|nr:hypothetical protein [Aquella oligotrophica]AUR50803.1 hypothetical protein CUN60_00320 [Aquella oligotrophica]
MNQFFTSILFVCILVLAGCSSFSSNKSKSHIKESDILPAYANAYNLPESITSTSLFNGYYEESNLTLLADTEEIYSNLDDGDLNNSKLNLPILFGQLDYSKDKNIYPLIYTELALIIPNSYENRNQKLPDINNEVISFTPSSYNLQTLQADNLESALRNSALLVNRAQFLNHNLSSSDKIKTRQQYLSMSKAALKVVYTKNPDLKANFESAVAFGVFEINNYNVLLYVGAYGKGVIFDNKNKKVIYMYTSRAGTGPGIGYESLYIIFVFRNQFALQQFIGAKGSGADIGASATLGVVGGQFSFNPEVSVYQVYKNGFDLQANWGGLCIFLHMG